jgi:hypothetical protein
VKLLPDIDLDKKHLVIKYLIIVVTIGILLFDLVLKLCGWPTISQVIGAEPGWEEVLTAFAICFLILHLFTDFWWVG